MYFGVCEFGVRTLYYFNSAYALHLALKKNVHGKVFLTTDYSTATTQPFFFFFLLQCCRKLYFMQETPKKCMSLFCSFKNIFADLKLKQNISYKMCQSDDEVVTATV